MNQGFFDQVKRRRRGVAAARCMFTALACAGTLAACAPSEPGASTARVEGGFIAFIGSSADDPLWPIFNATAQRYQEGLSGLRVTIRVPKLRSPNEQIRLIRELHDRDMRGLCIQPADTEIMRDILCELQVKGVAVVTLMDRIECEDPLPFAGVDEMAVGRALADALASAVGGKGSVALLGQVQAPPGVHDRLIGFRERMQEWPNVELQREMDCEGKTFVAERMVRDYMERFPRLDAWIALDNWPLRELSPEPRLLPASCRLVTTTPYPQFWPLIYDGTCAALVGSAYERVAQEALRMCVISLRGEPLNNTAYLAPPVTVTIRNLNWYRVNWFKLLEQPAKPQPTVPGADGAP